QIFAIDHKYIPYFVSSLCYFRIEQFFRSGELSVEYKKARFHLMMIVKLLATKCEDNPLNSNKLEKACEAFKELLLDERKAIEIFHTASEIFRTSGIDLTKRQYKSETDTELLKNAVSTYLKI
ncbi:hypothetical protein, partial [Pseudomonas sp. KCJK8993]|uniref:hypothetical protein n=1 Tax=Pseudomonas sp. KCJK8993 TaxID=3344565 RepID=UPI003905BC36